jgi:hypothetical protein
MRFIDGVSLAPGRKPAGAFREWGDYMVGGVWTTTNAKGSKEEVRFERILDKSFIRGTWKSGDETREDVYGIDHATGRWTFWGFGSKGEVYTGVAESEKPGEWTYRGAGQGKNGAISFRNKDIKLGADKDRFELQEYVWDGKKAPAEVQVWTRKK